MKETNLWGGGQQLGCTDTATNIHFTNGAADPWKSLSVLKVPKSVQIHQRVSAFVIQGGSHCTDFYSPSPSDSSSLKEGRKAIKEAVASFIEAHRNPSSSSNSSSSSSSSRESGAAAAAAAAAVVAAAPAAANALAAAAAEL
ncbi:Protein F23B2.12, partially confirmed by transcript evidence, related, related [Eimeria tenella]|uniref:Protein F23B2.12, partially confirmed by transcript evidence, related, related n=1 Tax=Eimeria tenella TaxID=5802 RepID=U6KS82_EIMTE